MTAPHDKLAGIRPGDRVRVTYEAIVTEANSAGLSVHIDTPPSNDGTSGRAYIARITTPETSAETFQIERIEPPLSVGDRVRIDGAELGKVLAVSDGLAWVRSDSGIHLSWVVESLERIA